METSVSPRSSIDLPTCLYYQVVHTLTNLLPPPLDGSLQTLNVRNRAAIAKVAALLPVNADEVDLAAQCIAARAQAEDILCLIRQHAGDIALVTRLNAQYGSMVRTSLSVHGRLMKVQALRQKREATAGAADQDAWTQHVAEQSTMAVLDPSSTPFKPSWPAEARPTSPEVAPVDTPSKSPTASSANAVNQTFEEFMPKNETDSHDAAFETWLSEQPWNRGSSGPEETALRIFRESSARARTADAPLTANNHQSPSMANKHCHDDTKNQRALSGTASPNN